MKLRIDHIDDDTSPGDLKQFPKRANNMYRSSRQNRWQGETPMTVPKAPLRQSQTAPRQF
jgi:hypothetical protein